MDEAQGGGECEADVATVTAKTGSRAVEAGDVAMVAARTGSRAAIAVRAAEKHSRGKDRPVFSLTETIEEILYHNDTVVGKD